jgi:hypothetical protein
MGMSKKITIATPATE